MHNVEIIIVTTQFHRAAIKSKTNSVTKHDYAYQINVTSQNNTMLHAQCYTSIPLTYAKHQLCKQNSLLKQLFDFTKS